MLNDLVLMINAAEKVTKEDHNHDEGKPTFGHLIILVRDVDGKAMDIKDLVLGEEATKGRTHKERVEMNERNMIRGALKAAFESITFHTMPLPHPDILGEGSG